MNLKFLSIFLILITFNFRVFAVEPLIKYNIVAPTNPSTGQRIPDNEIPNKYRNTGLNVLDPNSPRIGDKEDCYPDDPNNPEGNILISGKIISKETNKPINGAVVAIYMGNENVDNRTELFGDSERFVVGQGERLTNLYYYDVTQDGSYKVYACNDYKSLAETGKTARYGPDFCVDGYTKTGDACTHFDFVKAYPKFYLAVVCGMSGYERPGGRSNPNIYLAKDEAKLKPWIGEILSIDNFNEPYKSANRPTYLAKRNFDIRVSCADNLEPFPVPMFLDYTSDTNIASCRMDDVSPDLVNYFKKVQSPLRSSSYNLSSSLVPGGSVLPSIDSLTDCIDPNNPLCAKNFITKSFPVPEKDKNVFNYNRGTYIEGADVPPNANMSLRNQVLSYNTSVGLHGRSIDFENNVSSEDYLPKDKGSSFGQIDAKLDAKTVIEDVKFDLNSLKDLYACFTKFNFPINRSNAEIDEEQFSKANPALGKFYTPNVRIPTCRELYCGTQFVSDSDICNVKYTDEDNGYNFGLSDRDRFVNLNALSGYGPGVTLSLRTQEDITKDLMVLVDELIKSDFNPKKDLPGVKYKPVKKMSDIIACTDDRGSPVLLNDDGSITYNSKKGEKKFFSPVPMMSFISIPYNIEFLHAITNDSYMNKTAPTGSLYQEECNIGSVGGSGNDKQFANCRSAIIPGGVYSISALRVIAKMCTDVTKLPTYSGVVFDKAIGSTQLNTDALTSGSANPGERIVELAVTKIGTPTSLCLCDPNSPTAGCTPDTKLNSKFGTSFGTASFVKNNDQWAGNNYLGTLCNMSKKDSIAGEKCSDWVGQNSGYNLKDSSNFVGGGNLGIMWSYSYSQHKDQMFINHTVKDGFDKPQTDFGGLPNLNSPAFWSVFNKSNGENYTGNNPNMDLACKDFYTREDANSGSIPSGKNVGDCKNYFHFVPSDSVTDVSSVQRASNYNVPNAFEAGNVPTVPLKEVTINSSGEVRENVIGSTSLYQLTNDGTKGYVYTKYDYLNQKYDPIPDLLNDFRDYTVFGNIPSGGLQYCRTPKLATLVDFKTAEFITNTRTNSGNPNEDGLDMNYSVSRGVFCNEVMPDEFERCDQNLDITEQDRRRLHGYTVQEECKLRKCLTLCNQLYPTYEFYSPRSGFFDGLVESATSATNTINVPTDASGTPIAGYLNKNKVYERAFFCKNTEPKSVNVALEMNKGNEGCVVDYTRKIREVYTLPIKTGEGYVSRIGDRILSKENYPVYNNQLCINPINQFNPISNDKNSLFNDQFNCKPFIEKQRPNDFR